MADFQHCEDTVKFIWMFNKLFDVLNSRNLQGHGFKSPMRPSNIAELHVFFNECKAYIVSLKELKDGRSILLSNRKTDVLGFVFARTVYLGCMTFWLTLQSLVLSFCVILRPFGIVFSVKSAR